jgi:DNA (cytosine-5)-methyltransferase 1
VRILDLYCCQGGIAAGFAAEGHEVTGIDIAEQPRYPFQFIRADAIAYALRYGAQYDFIHASPPCQFATRAQKIRGCVHPNLIPATRQALQASGRPYTIENVEGAREHLENPLLLCGALFGLHTYRHRLFECGGGFSLQAPPHPAHRAAPVKMGRPVERGQFYHAVGNFSGAAYIREDLGMPWADRDGLRECVPPAYGRYIAASL